jgi:hypothetical protein
MSPQAQRESVCTGSREHLVRRLLRLVSRPLFGRKTVLHVQMLPQSRLCRHPKKIAFRVRQRSGGQDFAPDVIYSLLKGKEARITTETRRHGRCAAARAARRRWPMKAAACMAARALGRGLWRASLGFALPVRRTGFTALKIKRRGGARPPLLPRHARCWCCTALALIRWRRLRRAGCGWWKWACNWGGRATGREDPAQREEGGAVSRS